MTGASAAPTSVPAMPLNAIKKESSFNFLARPSASIHPTTNQRVRKNSYETVMKFRDERKKLGGRSQENCPHGSKY